MDWEETKALLALQYDSRYKNKNELPVFFPGTFKSGEKDRVNTAVESLEFCVLDYDGDPLEGMDESDVVELVNRLEGFAYYIYTTWSNAKVYQETGRTKLRLVIPFSRSVTQQEWPLVWKAVYEAFGKLSGSNADSKCKNPARMYYRPFVPYAPEADGTFEHDFATDGEGTPLDVDTLLEAGRELAQVTGGVEGVSRETVQTKAKVFHVEQLESLVKTLGKSTNGTHLQVRAWLKRVIKKEALPFEPGERHDACLLLTKVLAEYFPLVEPTVLGKVLNTSLVKMNQEGPREYQIELKELVAMLAGAQAKQEESDKAYRNEKDQELIEHCKSIGLPGPDTEEQVDDWCYQMGLSRSQLRKRLIFQFGTNYRVFFKGGYEELLEKEAINGIQEYLKPIARLFGLQFQKASRDGFIKKSPSELCEEYGTSAFELLFESGRDFYEIDEDARLLRAPLFKAKFPGAEKSEFVEGWFKALCFEDKENLERLEQWVGWSVQLNKPLSLLFLSGAPGSGKTLFAEALSSVWGKPPGEASIAFQHFNGDDLLSSPIVLADEGFPVDRTKSIRSLLGKGSHKVEKKYRDVFTVNSYYRLVVTANNDSTFFRLKTEVLNQHDLEALAARTFQIKVPEAATEYLEKAGRDRIGEMLKSGEFARHAQYLAEKHKDAPRARFGTKPNEELLRAISVSSGVPSALIRWIINYLTSKDKDAKSRRVDRIRVSKGRLLLNIRAFDDWQRYLPNERQPDYDAIRTAFSTITYGGVNKKSPSEWVNEIQDVHLSVLSKKHLFEWIQENRTYVTEGEIEQALSVDTPINWKSTIDP